MTDNSSCVALTVVTTKMQMSYWCLHLLRSMIMGAYLWVLTYVCLPMGTYLWVLTYGYSPMGTYLWVLTYGCLPMGTYLWVLTYGYLPMGAFERISLPCFGVEFGDERDNAETEQVDYH